MSDSKKENMAFKIFIVILVLQQLDGASANQCEASSSGTNFIFGIIGYRSPLTGTPIHLHITTSTAQTTALVRVTAPFMNFDRSYTVSNYTVVGMNGTLVPLQDGKQFKAVEVNSNVNISVSVVTGTGDLTEGFLALPVTALGTRYIAASYYPYSYYSSEILIAAVENDTDVVLSTTLNGHIAANRTFRLQKFETYQFKSDKDLSGSVVTSNKPVAVISGCAYAQIPVGTGDYQYIVEQMIPTNYWTKTFIAPPIFPREHFVLKIFADHDNTVVHYYNTTKHVAVYMSKRSVKELLGGTDPVVVVADKPISVVLYGYDVDIMYGDPFMVNVQGVSQFQDSYQFVTQTWDASGSNTIAITVHKNDSSGLRLNGQSLNTLNAINRTVAQPMEDFVTLFVSVSYNSYYRLYHTQGVEFGATLYGRPHSTVAYGYPLHLTFSDTACSATSTSTFGVHTSSTAATTHSNQHFKHGNDTWCFQCDGMSHLKYCDEVHRCQSENEVCYVQRYPRSLNENLYRSGCIHSEKCNQGHSADSCTECCSGSFCNSKGCGDDGLLPREQRGPICFDCSHIGEDEDCKTVQLCLPNQTCMVARYAWGVNDFHYIMGCSETQVCRSQRSNVRISRHTPLCTHCCHDDFCNMNCSSLTTSPAIVG